MTQSLKFRLLKRREINENGCWIWTGVQNGDGYGHIGYNYRKILVHRAAAMLWLDYDINCHDSQHQINHKCPYKLCFNPDHLYVGSQSKNISEYWHPEERPK